MASNKILTIQDISCVGQCSLTVALPIISACGIECAVLPSAVLSTHTAGFTGFTVRDLTDDIPGIREHWMKEVIKFSAIYTGYLGSTQQINYVAALFRDVSTDDCITVVDPAMADNGKLYPGFDDAFVEAMKGLCSKADYLVPNITEACFLTGMEYHESYNETYINDLMSALHALGAKTVVLTGVSFHPEQTGVMISEQGVLSYYPHRRLPESCHGTGDVYASAFVGALMKGLDAYTAAKIAADYTLICMENTRGDKDHTYGVKFEPMLGTLMDMIHIARKMAARN